jgi:hypothetical protein
MSIKRTLIGAAALAALPGLALADDFLKFGEVDGWKVFIDSTAKHCLIEKVDAEENVVQMGLTDVEGVRYVGVFTKGETGLKDGQKEAVAILMGDNLYLGEATGKRGSITKGYSGGYVLSDDPAFVTDVMDQKEMIVFPEKEYGFVVDLTGTKKAIEMARACNAEQSS